VTYCRNYRALELVYSRAEYNVFKNIEEIAESIEEDKKRTILKEVFVHNISLCEICECWCTDISYIMAWPPDKGTFNGYCRCRSEGHSWLDDGEGINRLRLRVFIPC